MTCIANPPTTLDAWLAIIAPRKQARMGGMT
jgi:hypothetical protein